MKHQWGSDAKKNSSTTRGQSFAGWTVFHPKKDNHPIIHPKRSCGTHHGFSAKGSSPSEIRPLLLQGFRASWSFIIRTELWEKEVVAKCYEMMNQLNVWLIWYSAFMSSMPIFVCWIFLLYWLEFRWVALLDKSWGWKSQTSKTWWLGISSTSVKQSYLARQWSPPVRNGSRLVQVEYISSNLLSYSKDKTQ